MVPLQVQQSMENGDPLHRTEILLVGGGEIHPAMRENLRSLPSPAIWESFAMTETYSHFALRRINGKKPDRWFRVLPGVHLERDSRGCLVVEMTGVTKGKVVTSDMVELHEEGNRFRWLGRYDNVISSGGIKIHPETLEEKIRGLLNHDCLVLSEPDPGLGRRLVLLVEDHHGRGDPEAWMELLRGKLSPYELPKRMVRVEKIPRNASFKPDRSEAAGKYL
jgi:O-succinylbenzoic acid--CoA ligase